MRLRSVWHVTNTFNLGSIYRHGLSWGYSRGTLDCVWFVSFSHLPWAFSHVAHSHVWDKDYLVALLLKVPESRLVKTSCSGLFRGAIKDDFEPGLIRDCRAYLRFQQAALHQ